MAVDRLRRPGLREVQLVPAALAGLAILLQVLYPLAGGTARDRLTIAVVLVFAAASLSHAAACGGARTAALVAAVTAGVGYAAEVLGVHTGVPFGRYDYAATLGIRVWGVPVVVALAWTMLAWPAALVARRLVTGFGPRVVVGAWALASWDLFLDPQMVAAGHWRWRFPTPHLPGVGAVPLTNYLGWLAVSLLISLVLQGLLRTRGVVDDRVPVMLYGWTYLSSVLALAVFLHLGAAAAWGALGMGLVAVPLARSLRSRR